MHLLTSLVATLLVTTSDDAASLAEALRLCNSKEADRILAGNPSLAQAGAQPLVQYALGCNEPLAWLDKLVARKVPIDTVDEKGRTALYEAVERSSATRPYLDKLLALGADPNKEDNEGFSPLRLAAYLDEPDVVEKLLKSGGKASLVSAKRGSLLSDAGGLAVVQALFAGGAPLDTPDGEGRRPIIGRARSDPKAVDFLLSKGVKLAFANNDGFTPLHGAAQEGHLELARRALAAGTDVNAKDRNGTTPLMEAAQHSRVEVMRLLLDKGAQVNIASQSSTPLIAAVEANFATGDPVGLLLSKGADPNFPSKEGGTPLLAAVTTKGPAMMERLLAAGARVTDLELKAATRFEDRAKLLEPLVKAGQPAVAAPYVVRSKKPRYVLASSLRLREGPSATAAVVAELPIDTACVSVESQVAEGWEKFQCDGDQGYSKSEFFGDGRPSLGDLMKTAADKSLSLSERSAAAGRACALAIANRLHKDHPDETLAAHAAYRDLFLANEHERLVAGRAEPRASKAKPTLLRGGWAQGSETRITWPDFVPEAEQAWGGVFDKDFVLAFIARKDGKLHVLAGGVSVGQFGHSASQSEDSAPVTLSVETHATSIPEVSFLLAMTGGGPTEAEQYRYRCLLALPPRDKGPRGISWSSSCIRECLDQCYACKAAATSSEDRPCDGAAPVCHRSCERKR
jgi:ankyrin repeat protein